jgi:hypothetical protein
MIEFDLSHCFPAILDGKMPHTFPGIIPTVTALIAAALLSRPEDKRVARHLFGEI